MSPNSDVRGTKSSHYVWKRYLKSFAYDGRRTYVKNIESGDVYPASIDRVGMTNNIYRLDKPISKFEQHAACYVNDGILSDERDIKCLNEVVGFLNNAPEPFMLNLPEQAKNLVKLAVKSKINPEILARNQEELFTFYESNFVSIYDKLLKNDVSFFNSLYEDKDIMVKGYCAARFFKTSNFLRLKFFDLLSHICGKQYKNLFSQIKDGIKNSNELFETELKSKFAFHDEKYFNAYYFLIFLLTQYFRTEKRILEITAARNFITEKHPNVEFDLKSFSILLIHFKMFYTGLGLIKDNYKIRLLFNGTETPFITSDQPIINTFASEKITGKLQEHEFELFYPLNPQLAMMFYNYADCSSITVNDTDVIKYNTLIENCARKFLYSNKKFD